MKNKEKTTKKGSEGLVIILTIAIVVLGIVGLFILVNKILQENRKAPKYTEHKEDFSAVQSMEVDFDHGDFTIYLNQDPEEKQVKLLSFNDNTWLKSIIDDQGNLKITFKRTGWKRIFNFNCKSKQGRMEIVLPQNLDLHSLKIKSGAAKVDLKDFSVASLEIEAGVGSLKGENIKADKTKITGGVGEIKFTDVVFRDSNIESGVGRLYIKGQVLGDSQIEAGVGEVELDLEGKYEDYGIEMNLGLGQGRIDGKNISGDFSKQGSGQDKIKIDGGIGNIKIKFN